MASEMATDGVGMLSESLSGASPSSLIVGAIIALLVISNLWTLSSGTSSSRETSGYNSNSVRNQRNNLMNNRNDGNGSPELVALAIRDVLKEFLDPVKRDGQSPLTPISGDSQVGLLDPVQEAKELMKLLDDAESRIGRLRDSLKEVGVEAKGKTVGKGGRRSDL